MFVCLFFLYDLSVLWFIVRLFWGVVGLFGVVVPWGGVWAVVWAWVVMSCCAGVMAQGIVS